MTLRNDQYARIDLSIPELRTMLALCIKHHHKMDSDIKKLEKEDKPKSVLSLKEKRRALTVLRSKLILQLEEKGGYTSLTKT